MKNWIFVPCALPPCTVRKRKCAACRIPVNSMGRGYHPTEQTVTHTLALNNQVVFEQRNVFRCPQ